MGKQAAHGNRKTSQCDCVWLTQGFTLTEIMVIVIIFAVIAAFALPGLGKMVRKSRERSAILSLTSVYSANDIYEVKFNEFWPGPGANVAAINTGLEIGINSNNMSYVYTRSAVNAYRTTAAWTGSTPFTVRVDERSIALANNPCCSAGTCPTLPACP